MQLHNSFVQVFSVQSTWLAHWAQPVFNHPTLSSYFHLQCVCISSNSISSMCNCIKHSLQMYCAPMIVSLMCVNTRPKSRRRFKQTLQNRSHIASFPGHHPTIVTQTNLIPTIVTQTNLIPTTVTHTNLIPTIVAHTNLIPSLTPTSFQLLSLTPREQAALYPGSN